MNFQNVSLPQSIKEDLRNISQSDLKLRSPCGKPLGRMWLQISCHKDFANSRRKIVRLCDVGNPLLLSFVPNISRNSKDVFSYWLDNHCRSAANCGLSMN